MDSTDHGPHHGRARAGDLAVLFSTVLWGTLWIPVRRMHESGASGAWVTTLGFLVPLLVLLPAAFRRRGALAGLRPLAPAGFWLALGIALYTEGVVRGQIARVILLFYLTPVWSTLLARVVLGQPITGRRLATILLGLAGMFVVFGVGEGPPLPRGAGDWMGLVAGFSWAIAIVATHRDSSPQLFERVFVHFLLLGPIYFAVALLPGGEGGGLASFAVHASSLPWLLAFGLIWLLPVVWLTLFGASEVDPGRFALLLMFEVIVGLTTAALLTDEPFGGRELAGAALIMSAIGFEIVDARRAAAAAVSPSER